VPTDETAAAMTLHLIRHELVNSDHTIRNHPGFRLRSQSRRIAVPRRKGREIHLTRRVEPLPRGHELSGAMHAHRNARSRHLNEAVGWPSSMGAPSPWRMVVRSSGVRQAATPPSYKRYRPREGDLIYRSIVSSLRPLAAGIVPIYSQRRNSFFLENSGVHMTFTGAASASLSHDPAAVRTGGCSASNSAILLRIHFSPGADCQASSPYHQ